MGLERITEMLDPNPDEQGAFKYPPNSNYGRLLRKWNTRKADGGMNVNGFEKFPMMLHRAQQHKSGKWVTSMPEPEFDGFRNEADFMRELQRIDKFNRTCQQIAQTESEYERMRGNGEGWRDTPDEAMKYREELEKEIGRVALERQIKDRKMSPAAQAESKAADDATMDHVPVIPSTPIRKPGKRVA